MTPEEIQAEKLRRQKLQEESDFEVAKEMLGTCYITLVACIYLLMVDEI